MNFMTEFNGEHFLVSGFSGDKEIKREIKTRFNDKRVYKKLQTAEKEALEYESKMVKEFGSDCKPDNFIIHICKDCNSYFTISYDEYKFYTEHEFVLPERCPACRKIRRNRKKEGENNG